jgi:hypothetical protein
MQNGKVVVVDVVKTRSSRVPHVRDGSSFFDVGLRNRDPSPGSEFIGRSCHVHQGCWLPKGKRDAKFWRGPRTAANRSGAIFNLIFVCWRDVYTPNMDGEDTAPTDVRDGIDELTLFT